MSLARCAALAVALAACEPADSTPMPDASSAPPAAPVAPGARDDSLALRALLDAPGADSSVCRRFAHRVARAAAHHPADAPAFLRELQAEFVAGAADPFELERGLREGRWNQDYVYAGHGGFRAAFDDDRAAYRDGGNHQPGHFVSVLSVAAGLGAEQARLAIAYAGDYEPREEDDLRLSEQAIPLGEGLADGTVSPAEVAGAAAGFCR